MFTVSYMSTHVTLQKNNNKKAIIVCYRLVNLHNRKWEIAKPWPVAYVWKKKKQLCAR